MQTVDLTCTLSYMHFFNSEKNHIWKKNGFEIFSEIALKRFCNQVVSYFGVSSIILYLQINEHFNVKS